MCLLFEARRRAGRGRWRGNCTNACESHGCGDRRGLQSLRVSVCDSAGTSDRTRGNRKERLRRGRCGARATPTFAARIKREKHRDRPLARGAARHARVGRKSAPCDSQAAGAQKCLGMNERLSLSVVSCQLFKTVFSNLCDLHKQLTTDNGLLFVHRSYFIVYFNGVSNSAASVCSSSVSERRMASVCGE